MTPRRLLPLLFLTLALADTAAGQTVALLSDINGRYGSTDYSPRVDTALEALIELQPAAVISTGDMVAGQKQPLLGPGQLDAMWQGFNKTFTEPLARAGIPLAITPGNHDASGFPAFARERQHFEANWKSRHANLDLLPGSEWPWRYAARLGTTLLLSFDGTRPGLLPASEREFLARMLEEHASGFETVIVFSHLPMWPVGKGRESEIIDDKELLALLHRHEVDVYASGHHHAFFAGRDDHGLLHLAVGALGGNSRHYSDGLGRQAHSFAVLEIDGGSVYVSARTAPDFTRAIEPDRLPARIDGPLGRLTRLEASAFRP